MPFGITVFLIRRSFRSPSNLIDYAAGRCYHCRLHRRPFRRLLRVLFLCFFPPFLVTHLRSASVRARFCSPKFSDFASSASSRGARSHCSRDRVFRKLFRRTDRSTSTAGHKVKLEITRGKIGDIGTGSD